MRYVIERKILNLYFFLFVYFKIQKLKQFLGMEVKNFTVSKNVNTLLLRV